MLMMRISLVADEIKPTNDFTYSEKPNDLRRSDSDKSNILGAGIPGASQDALGRRELDALEQCRVASGIYDGLIVGLECGQGSAYSAVRIVKVQKKKKKKKKWVCFLRRLHALTTKDQFGQFKSDFRVIDGRGYQCYVC